MTRSLDDVVIGCLRLMMRPMVRFCLRRSLKIQEITEAAKVALIQVASEEIEREGMEVNISRLAVMTGMHRRDVARIHKYGRTKDEPVALPIRIINHWRRLKRFQQKNGRPKVLSFDGRDAEFRKLVQSISQDIDPAVVLFELERVGAVERVKGGIKLVVTGYVPRGEPERGFELLAEDTEELMIAVEENVFGDEKVPNFHGKTLYDNVFQKDIPKIRKWLLTEASTFHRKINNYLSKYDKDIHPDVNKEGGGRVVLGSFSRCYVEKD